MYYLANGSQQHGPFKDIDEIIQNPQLSPNSLIWKIGMPNWILASELAELKPHFNAIPPPIPLPPAPPPLPESQPTKPLILTKISEETHLGERFAGIIIDLICYAIGGEILRWIINLPETRELEVAIGSLITVSFECMSLMVYNKTPSKFLFKTQVLKNDNTPMTLGEAFGRTASKYILFSIPTVLVYYLGKEKRFFHNRFTSVIKEN